jgi:predicted permease
VRRFFARLGAFLHRGRAERELAREVAAHLTLLEDDFLRRGISPREARLAALRAYGGVEQSKELHRDARSFVALEQALQDLRHAIRGLRKSPGFVAVALLSLACGIGVNASIFTLVNGILLKRLPVPDADRMVQVGAHLKQADVTSFNFPVFRELRRRTEIFSSLVGFRASSALIDLGNGARQTEFSTVTGSYFPFFGARPALGRLIDEDDDRAEGAHPVCVISYRAWQTHFAGDPGVLGRAIRVDGVSLQVIGVASAGFVGADLQRRDDVWVPTAMISDLSYNRRETPNWIWLSIMGRLAPGVSLAEARSRLTAASGTIEAALPTNRANDGAEYQLLDGSKGNNGWRTSLHDPLVILMGAVSLVLLVACANLANLVLARAGERRQEFAIKLALGITRLRLLRQLLLETLLVTLAGGTLAVLLSLVLAPYLLDIFNGGNSGRELHVAPDGSVLLYTFGGCLVTALLAGLYPALQAARTDVGPRLAAPSNSRRSIVRRGLILVQVTLAVVLLFGASVFTDSLRKLKTVDLGFDLDRTLSVEIADARPRRDLKLDYPPAALSDTLARVRQLPGVESAAFASPGVLAGGMMSSRITATGSDGQKRSPNALYFFAGAGFFQTMRIPLLKGRDFTPADRAGTARVAIVNERLASLLWPGEDPVGKHIPGWGMDDVEVVGVASNSKYQRVRETTRGIVYQPFDQMKGFGGTLEIRGRGDLREVERDVRRIVQSTAPAYQVARASSIELMRDGIISQDRLLAFLSGLFGAVGTALALVGIYGLISYSVTRRTREVGIRVSIGAQRGHVLWLFLRESTALIAAGMLLGLPLALQLSRFTAKMLYDVSTSEPRDIAVTLLALALGGAAASYIPGRRATRIDPVQALRYD